VAAANALLDDLRLEARREQDKGCGDGDQDAEVEAEADHGAAGPRREQAQEREAFLRAFFTVRGSIINFALGGEDDDDPWLHSGPSMRLDQAPPLKMSEADARATLPVQEDVVDGVIEPQVKTERVVRLLLERLGRDRLRKLMTDLGVAVMVKQGRARAEWLEQGLIPLSQRVSLQVLGAVQARTDEANVSKFSYPVRLPSAESACGT
jgi:hypothetical protein